MLRGTYPGLLVLALSLPEVSHALGLGNMRVDSRLNEPLSAQIDIIGATPDELRAISASVASPELFQRYHAERPAFLSSATISLGIGANGKAVLIVQSTDAFTEPLVEFLIDLRSGNQQLVRDYSLLLDPPAARPAISASAGAIPNEQPVPLVQEPATDIPDIVLASVVAAPVAPGQLVLASNPEAVQAEMHYRAAAHDTLRRIAHHAGARSEVERRRLMLAIFQANQDAFAGNINLLRSGALLRIPAPAEIQAYDDTEVEREFRAQMTAWRRGARPAHKRPTTPQALTRSESVAAQPPATQAADVSAVLSKMSQLEGQVQFLQQTLGEANRQLASATTRLGIVERRAAQAAQVPGKPTAAPAKPGAGILLLSARLGGLGLLLGGLALAYRRFLSGRSTAPRPVRVEEPTIEAPVLDQAALSAASASTDATDSTNATDAYSVTESVPESPAAAASADGGAALEPESTESGATVEMAQVTDVDVDTVEERVYADDDGPDTVVMMNLEPETNDATGTALDYNLADLDGHAQHVEMPGTLRDQVTVVERRRNVVDTLMAAIQKDPTRSDLRMRLLETLYSAAATNLRVFKDVVRDVARHPERLNADEWEQVMSMGRQIAADDALFADQGANSNIADCA